MIRPLFYVLDGHALAYRHYFANTGRPLMTSSGVVTSAVYGFTRTVMDVLEKDKPHYMAVAFDEGLSGREEYFPDYKAHRDASPQDFETQIPIIRDIVTAFGIPLLVLPGYEADDLIGTATLQAVQNGADALIYSGDRDLLQLLDEHTRVRLYIPQAGVPDELYDVEKFRAKYELDPGQLIDLKALEGDTSDNIPGVPGIGRKGATSLLQQFGTLENIYNNLDQIKEGVRKKLEAGRESAFVSQRLATIQRGIAFDFELGACEVRPLDVDRLREMFRELEFNSLIRQIDRMAGDETTERSSPPPAGKKQESAQLSMFGETLEAPPPAAVPALFPTIIVQDLPSLNTLVAKLNAASLISFDTETTGTDAMSADLVGISLCVDGSEGYYIPVGHLEGKQLPLDVVIHALREPLTNPNIGKAAHNADYDVIVLAQHGLNVTPITFDTMIAEWVAKSHSQYLGLKRLAQHHLGVIMTEISELIGTGKNQTTMDKVPIAQAAPYAAADAVCTFQLVGKLTEQLDQVARQTINPDPLWGTPDPPTPWDVFTKLEIPLIPVLTTMEQYGVLLDTPYLADMSRRLAEALAALEEEIYALSGGYGRFNINSPKQLNDVLFGKLGLKAQGVRKTTHGFSTAADVLESMRGVHPIIDQIMNYRELSKLKGTYVDALPALINPKTGRVHTSFNQAGASTGRMSSSNPNLQNIPIRTETGREVRGAFIAPQGCKLLSVDYSQVELRIMAHVTREPTLLAAFARGEDIHAATAALVNRIPIEQVTKEQRSFAKRVNFGLLYGMGAFRLSRDSELTHAQAEAFIKDYFAQLPNVKAYLDRAKTLAAGKDGYLATLFGRRREFLPLQGATGNRNLQQAAEREAINMPIQGTAADIIKKAMIDLHAELQRRNSPAHLLLQVHDELVLEVPDAYVAETADLVVRVMENAADLAAPLKANAQVGQNWRDMAAL